jgi:hypothetical protein
MSSYLVEKSQRHVTFAHQGKDQLRADYEVLKVKKNGGGNCSLCIHSETNGVQTFCSKKRGKTVNKFAICHLFES